MNNHPGLWILLLLAFSTWSCRQNRTEGNPLEKGEIVTEIKGTIVNGADERVILEEMGAREYIPIDTVQTDESGAFHITFSQSRIAFYVLRYGSSGYITLLLEPGESLAFKGKLEEKDSCSITGSAGSALLQILSQEHKKTLDALGAISRKNRESVSSPDYAVLKQQLDKQFDSITSAFQGYSLRFIHENSTSPAILIALYNLYGQGFPVFDPTTDFAVYHFTDSALMASHGDLEAVQLLHAQVTEAIELMKSRQQSQLLKKGGIAPDFVSSRPDGSLMSLSNLRGNYVLLNFWASWSNLCREENATLVKARQQFGDKKFRILQVSIDDERSAWLAAIEEDGLDWDHVSDLKRWETPVVDLYGVEKIPFNVLIDPTGKIVETEVFGEKLLIELNQILNN